MSTQDESGVYYTPSLGGPNHHPDSQDIQQHPGYPQDALKQCSVKGCTETLSSNDTNKMCVGCRSRHRIYANTKRAKRKLEKAAVATAVAARSGKNTEMSLVDHAPQPITWVTPGQSHQDLRPSTSGSTSALSSLSTWNHAIDPRLFSGDGSPTSPLSSLMPHQTSTSSELANALTPRKPSTPVSVSASAILPNQTATDHNKHYHDRSASQRQSSHLHVPHTSVDNRRDDDDSNDNDEEQRVIESLQVTPGQDQQMGVSSSDRQTSSETAELSQGRSSDEVDGSARCCSVKGCKAAIPASYEYKMCPPCRTRYRTYGNTKRAKWKAERGAFDREMAILRTMEDEKRKDKGLRPLAESPEELHAWELSIIDEQVPMVLVDNSFAFPETSPVVETGSTQSLSPSPALIAGMNSPMVLAGVYPPSISSSSAADSSLASSHYNNPAAASLPARMCTVSHCHKILPGYYRYKRCEQHRLQNRHHSQLKRVREREVRGVGAEKGVALAEIPHEIDAGGRADEDKDKETKQATVALTTAGIEGGKDAGVSFSSTTGGGDSESKKIKSHDQKRSKFSCSAGDCHNLLLPTVRWRLCESCRSIDRQRKNQIKFEQKAAAEKEKMNVDSQVGVVSANEHAAEDDGGEAEGSQEINHAISAGAIDPDAEGDIDMGENDEIEPRAVENQQSIVSPPLPSMPPASMTGGFSRFHVTIDPRNASSSAALDPTTSTAQLVTLDDPLAFRAYRPKTTPSAIGRILARNPGLSVDAFTEVLQAEGASTDAMTLGQANATPTTKSIITPTIPTSAPFVYKAPEKKATPRATVAKGKRKATSEKPSTSSSTTPATPAPTSSSGVTDSTPSAPPGSYGSYGYPQYPYPYPYYMPSPYGMPPYPYSHAPPPAPSDTKQKPSSKSSTSTAASSSTPTQLPPSKAMPGYSPYPYPYPPPPYGYPPLPNGYPYRYVPGQQPYNGLPPGPSGPNSYPYPYYPYPPPTSTSAPFPKTAAAARERQRSQDTKFNYYHHGAGSSDSPSTPNSKRKRRKVDSDYLESFKAQTHAISISLAMNQAKCGAAAASSSVPTLPPASIASDAAPPPVVSVQPTMAVDTDTDADADAPSKSTTLTRPCANKTCNRSLSADTANILCDKCRLRFKKHQAKAKKRFKLEPRKSLLIGKKNHM